MVEPSLWRKRVVVTRPRARASGWVEAFAERGADVILFPIFSLELPDDETNLRTVETIDRIAGARAPWLAFTSVTGVRHLLSILAGHDRSLPEQYSIACVGTATARELALHGLTCDLQPDAATGADLASAIVGQAAYATIVHPTSSAGLGDVQRSAEERGCMVHSVVVSEHRRCPDTHASTLIRELDEGGIDLLTFASPSAATGLCELVDDGRLRSVPCVAVGPTTEVALVDLGFETITVAPSPNLVDVLKAVEGCLG